MYDSLKPWLNLAVVIKPFIKRSGTGVKEFGTPINTFCYAEGKVMLTKDSAGAEVTSTLQLYFAGTTSISVLDNILFEAREWPIKSVSTFYRAGVSDIKVVYL